MATIFSNPSRDHCLCACSSGGCTTSTILQNKWAGDPKYFSNHTWELLEGEEWSLRGPECLMGLSEPHNKCEDCLTNEIIRFNTFQELQLKHTCCKHQFRGCVHSFRVPQPEEVHEFRDEDSEGIKLLEELMIEFRNKRGDQSLMTFLQGYWTSRMKEVRRTKSKVDIEKSREIGIVWSKNSSFECNEENKIEELE